MPSPRHRHGSLAEPHDSGTMQDRTNKIRAAVLGANDGIVSTAGLVLGVAGATTDTTAIMVAGLTGLVAGSLSMAAGEYVSVSSQRDTEKALVDKERLELETMPDEELEELAGLFRDRGLSDSLARQVAVELTEKDALSAHTREELGIEPGEFTNPWAAALSSMVSFTLGALLPLIAILLTPESMVRVVVTIVAMIVALSVTGFLSARLGGAPIARAMIRNAAGGAFAMIVTYVIGLGIGNLLGTS
ncbi:MAG: VIT family protein [Candidatus Nanopelagicales bacterium]